MTLTAAPVAAPTSSPDLDRRARNGTMLAWGLAALWCAVYCALSIRDQQRMITSGFDLGIFDEAVRAYAHGHLPYVVLKGEHFDLLGDHFSPILATLAPLYLLFPSVCTLLIAQAALMAVGMVPLVRWAARDVGLHAATVVGIGYGASWGIASAIGFDMHEIAFAVPLLAFSATALGRRRWHTAVAWALPLLLVKEDLGVTVAMIGILIACRGPRRLGLLTAATGLLGSWLEINVLIPSLNPGGRYTYSGSITGALSTGSLPETLAHFITPETKVVTVLLMLAPTAFLALRSPITLLVLPTLAWRFLSDDTTYWGTGFQYSAVLMPIVFAGFIDALARLRAANRKEAAAGVRTALITSLAVTALLLPDFPLGALAHAATWKTDSRVAAAHRVLALIPGNATVAASNQLVPQLTDRDTVSLVDPSSPVDRPEWLIVDTQEPEGFPLSGDQQNQIIEQLKAEGYRTVADQAGYLLLESPRR